MRPSRAKRPLVVTIDAEAQPARTDRAPLDHLVHGEAGAGGFGLWRILDIADRHNATVTVFLDYAEQDVWGEGLLDVAREVRLRGHDLQVHLHPEFLARDRFEQCGLAPIRAFADASRDQIAVAVNAALEAHDAVAAPGPIAFRSGGYHVNDTLLSVLCAEGVTLDTSFVPAKHASAARGTTGRPFRWTNGLTELPVGGVPRFRNLDYPKAYNFNATFLLRGGAGGFDAATTAQRHAEFSETFWQTEGRQTPLVLVMHSWSLLRRGSDGRFGDGSELAAEALDLVLDRAKMEGSILSVAAIAERYEKAPLPLAVLHRTT